MGYKERQRRAQQSMGDIMQRRQLLREMLGKATPIDAPPKPPEGIYFSLWPISVQYKDQPARVISWKVRSKEQIRGFDDVLSVVEQIAADIQRQDGAPEPPTVTPLFAVAEFVPQQELDRRKKVEAAIEHTIALRLRAGALPEGEERSRLTAQADALEEAVKRGEAPEIEDEPPAEVVAEAMDGVVDLLKAGAERDGMEIVEAGDSACAGCDVEITLEQAEATRGLCPGCAETVNAPGPVLVTE